MSSSSLSSRDVVIMHAPEDGSLDVFVDFDEVDGYLLVSGVVDDAWTSFYRVDGEQLSPVRDQHGWVERLVPTGSRDLDGLVRLLSEYAKSHRFEVDGRDPCAFVEEMVERDYEARWPKWPGWLDRWMHGGRSRR